MAMKKCKECGEEISSSAKKCPKCGKDQRNFFMKHPILYSILILIVLCMIAGGNDSSNTQKVSSNNAVKDEIYNVGDAISTGTFELTVTDVSTSKRVGGKYFDTAPSEGGIYVCVDLKYKNVSNEPMGMFDYPRINLLDANGVEYSADISASSYYATEKDPDRKVLSDLNPGISVTDNKVFEIGEENYNNGEWFIKADNVIIKVK